MKKYLLKAEVPYTQVGTLGVTGYMIAFNPLYNDLFIHSKDLVAQLPYEIRLNQSNSTASYDLIIQTDSLEVLLNVEELLDEWAPIEYKKYHIKEIV